MSGQITGHRAFRGPWLAPTLSFAIIASVETGLAFAGGGFALSTRCEVAIVALWALVLILALRLGAWPSRPAIVIVSGLFALAVLDLLSMAWAANGEAAYVEFARTVGYAAIAAVVALLPSRLSPTRIADGLAFAGAIVGVAALASRLFPGRLRGADVSAFLPGAETRLTYPLNYWNALGIFVALAVPLLLGAAVRWRRFAGSALAVAALPPLVGTIYLTSSRGAFAVLALGVVTFLVVVPQRWPALAAAAIGLGGGAIVIAAIHTYPVLVSGPFTGGEATAAGHDAAFSVAVTSLVAALAFRAAVRLGAGRRVGSRVGWTTAATLVVGAVVLIVAAHPVARFEAFKRPAVLDPSAVSVEGHLLSGTGSGRWQLWQSALDEWRAQPLRGEGAGSYQAWWARNGTLPVYVVDAHSLYLETLGELGLLGFACLFLVFGGAAWGGVKTYRRLPSERVTTAALAGTGMGFVLALGLDWMWEMPAVGVLGFTALVTLVSMSRGSEGRGRRTRRSAFTRVAAAGLVLVALAVIVAETIPLLARARVVHSQVLAGKSDYVGAYRSALDARVIEPWAASPRLQLSLVAEDLNRLALADRWIHSAIRRSPDDWSLWFVAARIETERGLVAEARRSLDLARSLNPRSPIFKRGIGLAQVG